MKALPSCKRHAMAPTLPTTRFAQVPRQIPKAVHISAKRSVFLQQGRADERRTPAHDESTSDGRRGVLSRKDGNTARLGTHANTHEQTADQELRPGLGAGRSNDRPQTEVGSEKDDTSSSKIEVEGIRQPTADKTVTSRVSIIQDTVAFGSQLTRFQRMGQH